MDKGAWWAAVHGVAKSQTQLSSELLLNVCLLLERQPLEGRDLMCRGRSCAPGFPGQGLPHSKCAVNTCRRETGMHPGSHMRGELRQKST